MYDLITIGDITMDFFFRGKSLTIEKDRFHLAIGGKYLADEFFESLGGGAANVSAGVASFGLKVAVCAKVGENPFKQIILQKLTGRHVGKEFLTTETDYLNISSILLTFKGEKTVIHYVNRKSDFIVPDSYLKPMLNAKWFYMGNVPDMPINERERILRKAKESRVKICLNFGRQDFVRKPDELKKITDLVDILVLNTYEYAELTRQKHDEIDFSKDCSGPISFTDKILILTASKNGSYAYHKGKVFHQVAIKYGKVIDTTGAGDGYIAGFLASYINQENIPKAMLQAAEYAGKIIGKIGAQ